MKEQIFCLGNQALTEHCRTITHKPIGSATTLAHSLRKPICLPGLPFRLDMGQMACLVSLKINGSMIQPFPKTVLIFQEAVNFTWQPDIDFTKVKTNKKWLRTIFFCQNAFKCPSPALMLNSKGVVKFYPLYF